MNKIEKKMYEALLEFAPKEFIDIQPIIGPYKPDFAFFDKILIEVDGHEFHKTKEQRDKDYKRERYFQKEGYVVVRFTGTEVFLDALSCAGDAWEIVTKYEEELERARKEGILDGFSEIGNYLKSRAKEISEVL